MRLMAGSVWSTDLFYINKFNEWASLWHQISPYLRNTKELLLGVLNRIYKKILHELFNSLHYEKIIELDLSQYVMITESHRKNQDYCKNS